MIKVFAGTHCPCGAPLVCQPEQQRSAPWLVAAQLQQRGLGTSYECPRCRRVLLLREVSPHTQTPLQLLPEPRLVNGRTAWPAVSDRDFLYGTAELHSN